MPVRTLFDNLPLWGMFASILVVILVAVEVGYLLGKLRRERPKQEKEGSVSAMVGATLGLLAFMLAFTFGLAASRFDARRLALVDESNAVATTVKDPARKPFTCPSPKLIATRGALTRSCGFAISCPCAS